MTTFNVEKDRFELYIDGKLWSYFDASLGVSAVNSEVGRAELIRNGYEWVIEAANSTYAKRDDA